MTAVLLQAFKIQVFRVESSQKVFPYAKHAALPTFIDNCWQWFDEDIVGR
jgi:hypothetical protein